MNAGFQTSGRKNGIVDAAGHVQYSELPMSLHQVDREFSAVHGWHYKVRQKQVYLSRLTDPSRFSRVGSLINRMSRLQKHVTNQVPHPMIGLDQQYRNFLFCALLSGWVAWELLGLLFCCVGKQIVKTVPSPS